ncbi:flagellar M-ring protein FliF, partial [bacterium]|nr:flagellar M-ring protein FliF [bacterium]
RGGTTILVSSDRVSKLRINLASSGIISSGGVGYEIFDSNSIGATDFVQRLNLKRALEGELSRTISDITVVDKARVHIVFSKESIFKDKGREATASVVLNLSRGRGLEQSQVMGIANLVSYGVEGLNAKNVTIIDQDGRILTGNINEDVPGLNSARLNIKKQFENYLAGKAEKMLMTVIGPGRALVRVNAELDFREVKSTKEIYDPQTVVRSEETNSETNTNEGLSKETITTNYDINRTLENIVSGGEGVKSLSVAVFVDGHYEKEEGSAEKKYIPLSSEELGQLENIVKRAVGFDASRKDAIEVVNLQFYSTGEMVTSIKTPMMEWLPGLIGKGVTVIILVLLFLFLKKNLGKIFSSKGGGGIMIPRGGNMGTMGMVSSQEDTIESRAKEISDNNPEQVAKLVKTWMAD